MGRREQEEEKRVKKGKRDKEKEGKGERGANDKTGKIGLREVKLQGEGQEKS